MGAMSPIHLAIVVIVALLVFGPKKLPELAKGLGEAVKEFKKTMNGMTEPEHEPEASAPAVASAIASSEAPPAAGTTSVPSAGTVAAPPADGSASKPASHT
jgi:sec-independent protein translocase protein TatA